MSKNLFIIEAPGKIKKIKSFLGTDYNVMATKGHISDLPAKGLNVDIKKDFEPNFDVAADKKDLVKELKAAAADAKNIYIATDLDREGEGIAWTVAQQLGNKKFKRVKYNSITKKDIEKGIENAVDLDNNLVDAFIARRVLDRIAGYKTSFLVKKATGGPSAGRVQSAALRVLAEREKEIQSFVPVVYWPVTAELLTKDKDKIVAEIKKPKPLDISTQEEAEKICAVIKKGPVKVSKFEKKEVKTNAPPPFTADEMYRAASSVFGWKTKKTASVAQNLYTSGVITYHRTDSTFLEPQAIQSIRDHVSTYGKNYLPASAPVFAASANAQEAHEACRVVDVNVKEFVGGSRDDFLLYQMIWKRTVASQMTPMVKLSISAEFSVDGYVLGANGSKLLFDGWRKVWDYGSITDTELPELNVGDLVDCISVNTERKETQPPSRYSEGSLIKKLKEEGIGRPSTYPTIASTLENRKYIESKKSLSVTDLGMKVNDFLVASNICFSEIPFTVEMEEKLDQIARGEKTRKDVLSEFWNRLKSDLDKCKDTKKEVLKTEFECPACKKKNIEAYLCERESRFGKFYSCENYKTCSVKADIGENKEPVFKEVKEKVYSDFTCPLCESKMLVRKSQYGEFLGCSKFPKCRGLRQADGSEVEVKKKTYKKKFSKKKKRDSDE